MLPLPLQSATHDRLKSTLEKRSKRGSKEKRQRKRGGAEGKEEEAADLELTLKEEQAQLEQEKEAILKNQELLEEVTCCLRKGICLRLCGCNPNPNPNPSLSLLLPLVGGQACYYCLLRIVQERQSLLASTQDRVEQLKKEQKKRDSLASKIKVCIHLSCCCCVVCVVCVVCVMCGEV